MEIIRPGRRVGNTTRQVDKIIDDLFKNASPVRVLDHGKTRIADDNLLDRVIRRLVNEHRQTTDNIEIYRDLFITTIRLKEIESYL